MIRWVVFDLDGTLYDSNAYFSAAFKDVANRCHQTLASDPVRVEHIMWRILRTKGSQYPKLFDDLLGEIAPMEDQSVRVSELVQVFHNAPLDGIRLYEDAARFLSRYQGRLGFSLLTNGGALKQRRKVEALSLTRWMTHIVYCQDLAAPKPLPTAFQHLLNLLNCRGDSCVYVGDNPDLDLPGAKAVGMWTVHLNRGEFWLTQTPSDRADAVVSSFDDLNEWLRGKVDSCGARGKQSA